MAGSPGQDTGPVRSKYVIIGNSAGAVGAIEAIRQVDVKAPIAAISEEPYPPYSRPLIADFLSGHRTIEQIFYRPMDFYEKKGVVPVLDAKVARIDFDARQILFENTKRFPHPLEYERLLMATGGSPFVPPTEGGDKRNVHTFVSLREAVAIQKKVGDVNKVIVVGGGLIGMCVADALVRLGKKVTVVELLDRVLNMNLDKAGSELFARTLDARGVRVITKDSVSKFVGKPSDEGRVGGAILNGGEKLDCDMVIVAIGVRPRIELVKGTKVKVNRGIVVDRHMETNVPGVYACGDVAEAYDFVWDENRLSPIWPNAYLGGRSAGFNMAGKQSDYPGSTGMTSFTYFDLPVISAGMNALPSEDKARPGQVTEQEAARYEVLMKGDKAGFYRKLILKDGKLKGFIMMNDVIGAGILTDLMRDRVDVSGFKQALMSEELGMAHLPKDMIPARLQGQH